MSALPIIGIRAGSTRFVHGKSLLLVEMNELHSRINNFGNPKEMVLQTRILDAAVTARSS